CSDTRASFTEVNHGGASPHDAALGLGRSPTRTTSLITNRLLARTGGPEQGAPAIFCRMPAGEHRVGCKPQPRTNDPAEFGSSAPLPPGPAQRKAGGAEKSPRPVEPG